MSHPEQAPKRTNLDLQWGKGGSGFSPGRISIRLTILPSLLTPLSWPPAGTPQSSPPTSGRAACGHRAVSPHPHFYSETSGWSSHFGGYTGCILKINKNLNFLWNTSLMLKLNCPKLLDTNYFHITWVSEKVIQYTSALCHFPLPSASWSWLRQVQAWKELSPRISCRENLLLLLFSTIQYSHEFLICWCISSRDPYCFYAWWWSFG